MRTRWLTLAAQLVFIFTMNAQVTPVLKTVCDIPPKLRECSTLERSGDSLWWAINDKGDKARIYGFDTSGLKRTISLRKAKAIDFEAMARNDQTGDLFIGDIGNNANDRRDLVIWIIPDTKNIPGKSVTPQGIHFTYPDQTAFPPATANWNFDAEAMFHFNHHLYIFSKDRSGDRYTKCYRLPDSAGTYVAELLDSIRLDHWITSADISPDGKHITLICENDAWVFSDFKADQFFRGKMFRISFSGWTQKEGVLFENNHSLLVSDETTGSKGGHVYRIDLSEYFGMTDTGAVQQIKLSSLSAPGVFRFLYRNDDRAEAAVELKNVQGKICYSGNLKMDQSSTLLSGTFDFSSQPKGEYALTFTDNLGHIVSQSITIR